MVKDWSLVSIGSFCKVERGIRLVRSQLSSKGKYPVYQNSLEPLGYYDEANCYADSLYIIAAGSAAEMGFSTIPFWAADDCYFFKNSPDFDQRYLYYVLLKKQAYLKLHSRRTSIPRLSRDVIDKLEIYLPEIDEQKAIAETIASFDMHIANLAELIEKKKAIRDGALEDLVSGRTRLAGFSEDWYSTTVGDCAEILQGGTPSTTNNRYWGGSVIWVTPSEITKLPTMYIDDSERKITGEGLQNSSAKLLPVGTILLCTRATIGDLAIARKPMTTNQGFKNLVCRNGIHNVFFAYLLYTLKPVMLSLAIGTTFLEISKRNLSSIEIRIPSFSEQQAIADVLTAMDNEIKALEDERDKMIQIREGAMDDLLTGRVRLSI